MKKVAVIGALGNMGKRYSLILEKYCGCEVVRSDIGSRMSDSEGCDGYIITTPTKTHLDIIRFLRSFKKPILCEKPVTKNIAALKTLLDDENLDLSMINQYDFLQPIPDDPFGKKHTFYDYFKTGNDGLLWDCINIIGLAKKSYDIKNESLIWKCQINGMRMSIDYMDEAYIDNIEAWVNGWRNKGYILPAHEKVARLAYDSKKD